MVKRMATEGPVNEFKYMYWRFLLR